MRRILILTGLALFVLVAAVFAYANRSEIAIDLGFVRLDGVSLAGAFVSAFVIGAVFGMGCMSLGWLRLKAERRSLRRRLSSAEAELSRLRSAPLEHAD